LLCGEPPFWHEDHFVLFERITEGTYDFSHPNWSQVSPEAKDFIAGLLVTDVLNRPASDQIVKHPWFGIPLK